MGPFTIKQPLILFKNHVFAVLLTPVSLSTDIMVDTPDEQSIVTYVAQFLEHFPELEAVCLFPLPLMQKVCISVCWPSHAAGVWATLFRATSSNNQNWISSP